MTSQAEPQEDRTGLQSLAYRYVPILAWQPEYNRARLVPDALAPRQCVGCRVANAGPYTRSAGGAGPLPKTEYKDH